MDRRAWKVAGAMGAFVWVLALWGAAAGDEPPAGAPPADSAAAAPSDTAAAAADTTAAAKGAAKAAHQYVGVKKCKVCHTSEKGGAQYKKWLESKHAKAYEALAGDLAKQVAKKKGIADPQKSGECLSCHQTGYGEPDGRFAATFVATDGVQCESCHGAGKDYMSRKVMRGITDGTLKGEDYGLVIPNKDRCVQCHNEKSPTFVAMDFAADSTKIAHPIPAGYKRGGADADEAGAK